MSSIGVVLAVVLLAYVTGVVREVRKLRVASDRMARHLDALLSGLANAATVQLRRGGEIEIRKWQEDVIIAKNGDARILRRLRVDYQTANPSFQVSLAASVGGVSSTQKRKIRVKVFIVGEEFNTQCNVSSLWREDVLTMFVHFPKEVPRGELDLVVEVFWPGLSIDLVSGANSEVFLRKFRRGCEEFSLQVTLPSELHFRGPRVISPAGSIPTTDLSREESSAEISFILSAQNVGYGQEVGFLLDRIR
ncbi:hypothetical protein ABZ342_20445 [Amycolatopsis sp. NPDC005961]|uniref:hypothetical protein n=1 Tax=Amycolatopsis sp. NPDC005961 TaxID=3156720 RepID=UPI0033C0B778